MNFRNHSQCMNQAKSNSTLQRMSWDSTSKCRAEHRHRNLHIQVHRTKFRAVWIHIFATQVLDMQDGKVCTWWRDSGTRHSPDRHHWQDRSVHHIHQGLVQTLPHHWTRRCQNRRSRNPWDSHELQVFLHERLECSHSWMLECLCSSAKREFRIRIRVLSLRVSDKKWVFWVM